MTMGRPSRPAVERFWPKVIGGSVDTCWEWVGAISRGTGYAAFWADGKRATGHRWSYEQLIGPIPDGLQLDHLCRNRKCVNPWHLEPVTPLVNTRRSQGNGSKTHCAQGHPFDEINTYRTNDGKRKCRTCRRAIADAYAARKAA